MRELVVKAVVNDPYDGLIRLLGDAQRFGFELGASMLETEADGSASVTLALSVPTPPPRKTTRAALDCTTGFKALYPCPAWRLR